MAKSVNSVTILGHVGNDPDVRATASGARVANFSVATNTYAGKNPDGSIRERTDWHRIAVWGRLVDIVEQYLSKGDRVLVMGEVQYTQDAQERWWTSIQARDVVLLGGDRQGEKRPAQDGPPVRQGRLPVDDEPDDDLPF